MQCFLLLSSSSILFLLLHIPFICLYSLGLGLVLVFPELGLAYDLKFGSQMLELNIFVPFEQSLYFLF